MRDKRGVKPLTCPNKSCQNHTAPSHEYVKDGLYKNTVGKRDSVQRFKCKACGKRFAGTYGTPTYRLRKPEINQTFVRVYSSGVSQRRAAYLIGVNRKTLAERLRRLGSHYRSLHENKMAETDYFKGSKFSFDEMESKISSKRTPVSISLAVNEQSGLILELKAAWMPLKGRLVEKMKRDSTPFPEYTDGRPEAYEAAFKAINNQRRASCPVIITDGYPSYPGYVKRFVENDPIHKVSLRNSLRIMTLCSGSIIYVRG